MASVTETRRTNKVRTISLIDREGAWHLVQIEENGRVDFYLVSRIPTDWGCGFVVEKQDLASEAPAEVYHVNTGDEQNWPECSCKGWTYHGKCRHVSGLRALQKRGILPGHSSLPDSSIREVGSRPAEPLSRRHRSLASAYRHEPEAFYHENTEGPDDAA